MKRSRLAITHVPSPQMEGGERTHVERYSIDCGLAMRQHEEYCGMLRDCGVEVRTLAVNRELPDCVFVEDTAIVLDELAILCSMGAPSRRAELPAMESELSRHREIRHVRLPATIDGGDVLQVGRRILVGLSSRTNREGAEALDSIVGRCGYRVSLVPVTGCLHLKSACCALPDGRLLVNPAWLDMGALTDFETISVHEEEPWAADIALVGSKVCAAGAHHLTNAMIRDLGFEVRTADLSEFAKAEGGVTCLSIIFSVVR